jgi:hypothetical protein
MKRLVFSALLLPWIACTSSSPPSPAVDAPLGQGTVYVDGTSSAVTAAWAELGFSFFGSANDSYGVYLITLTADPQAATLTCSERANVQTIDAFSNLSINTPQIYHQDSVGTAPVLVLGDIPVVDSSLVPTNQAPTSTIASFESSTTESGGTVTITAFATDSIDGTYAATGNATLAGSFSVPVCPPLP